MFERCTGFSIPDILIEKQIRQGSYDKNVGSKRPKNVRHTPDKFCQLKTGKRSGDPNEGVESRWFKSTLPTYAETARIHGEGFAALDSALSHYNTGSPTAGLTNGYVQQVKRHAESLKK